LTDRSKPFLFACSFRTPKASGSESYPRNPYGDYYTVKLSVSPVANAKAAEQVPDYIKGSLGYKKEIFDKASFLDGKIRDHYRCVSAMDSGVGTMRAELESRGLSDNTVIIFTSDNGEMMGDYGNLGKWIAYEGSIRVPHIIFDPRIPTEHRRKSSQAMVLNIDIAPSLLNLAGATIPDYMHGKSYLNLLRESNEDKLREDWFYEHKWTASGRIYPSEGIRSADWKYLQYYDKSGDGRLVGEQLFKVKIDPFEQDDLIDQKANAEIVEAMRLRLEFYYSLEGR